MLEKGTGFPGSVCSEAVSKWAQSSNDTIYGSLIMQKAAAAEFGGKTTKWQDENLETCENKLKQGIGSYTPFQDDHGKMLTAVKAKDPEEASRKVLSVMYNNTQKQLKDAGLKYVTLYRGVSVESKYVKGAKRGDSISYPRNALESWSTSKSVSGNFGEGVPGHTIILLKATVPASSIVSNHSTGFGCKNEHEFVVHNGKEFPIKMERIK